MTREIKTIKEATQWWVTQMNAIQWGIIEKLMLNDPDEWQEVTEPRIGDSVYVFELMDEWDTLEHSGVIENMTKPDGIYLITLNDGTSIQIGREDFEVEYDGSLPMWDTRKEDNMNRYYLTQRPPMPGAFPKPADNRVLSVESFDEKTYCMQIGQLAWGYIEYEHPLSEQQVSSYELVKGGQTMNRYMTMRERQQQKVNALPLGFAFGNRQFEEMMRGWGLDPEKDLDKIYRLGGTGGFYKKSDAQLIRDTFRKNREELEAAIEEDKTGEGFIYEMFLYELDNHEYGYTGDMEDTLDALGYTAEEVLGNPRLKRGIEKAVTEIRGRE